VLQEVAWTTCLVAHKLKPNCAQTPELRSTLRTPSSDLCGRCANKTLKCWCSSSRQIQDLWTCLRNLQVSTLWIFKNKNCAIKIKEKKNKRSAMPSLLQRKLKRNARKKKQRKLHFQKKKDKGSKQLRRLKLWRHKAMSSISKESSQKLLTITNRPSIETQVTSPTTLTKLLYSLRWRIMKSALELATKP